MNQLAKIHIAKAQLGLDDETYRALLHRVTGKDSAARMTEKQRATVLAEMRGKGWKPKPPKRRNFFRTRGVPAADKAALTSKMEMLLAEAGRSVEYADGMARKMFGVDRVEFLDGSQLHKLVAALVYAAKRHGRNT